MPITVEKLSDDELKALIENHRKANQINAPLHLDAMAELERRKGQGLTFEKSLAVIRRAALAGRFVSYKELADASGADWAKVHYSIGRHLWDLVVYAHGRGLPMLSAIVVNKPNVQTGAMEPETLRGFVAAARDLGFTVTDEEEFLRQQQRLVFENAAQIPAELAVGE